MADKKQAWRGGGIVIVVIALFTLFVSITQYPIAAAARLSPQATQTYLYGVLQTRAANQNPSTPTPITAEDQLELAYRAVEGVVEVKVIAVLEDEDGGGYSEIEVEPGYNTVETAQALMQAAITELETASIDFSTLLSDGETLAVSYQWDAETSSFTTTEMSAAATFAATRTPRSSFATNTPQQPATQSVLSTQIMTSTPVTVEE